MLDYEELGVNKKFLPGPAKSGFFAGGHWGARAELLEKGEVLMSRVRGQSSETCRTSRPLGLTVFHSRPGKIRAAGGKNRTAEREGGAHWGYFSTEEWLTCKAKWVCLAVNSTTSYLTLLKYI